jgi:hypothetical protein
MDPILWTCPYCNRPCTLQRSDIRTISGDTDISREYGAFWSQFKIVVCPNPSCRQLTITARIDRYANNSIGDNLYSWNLIPESQAKPFPEYIPKVILDDYREACLIRDQSPKASATLSRRCLQGMIRDFWEIVKGTLFSEISELKSKVDPKTWEAIDSVRQVGNIGAHMEKDVNAIVDVDPEEASMLIWLIETLFEDWYVERHDREEKMQKLIEMAQNKKTQQAP